MPRSAVRGPVELVITILACDLGAIQCHEHVLSDLMIWEFNEAIA